MNAQGISLLYAPPFSIVARFFLTASAFGLLGSLFALYSFLKGELYLQGMVHFFTLGFAGMTMVGALFQMLPVVAGAVIENPLRKATYTHITLSTGVFILILSLIAFLKTLSLVAVGLLSASLVYILSLMFYKVVRLKSYSLTSGGIRFSLACAVPGVVIGMLALLAMSGYEVPLNYNLLRELHFSLVAFGWTGILIVSVAFQVIEMFFVTPPYPERFAKLLPPYIALLSVLVAVTGSVLLKVVLSALFVGFAFFTISRLRMRRRRIADPLVSFWYVGTLFLVISMTIYPFSEFGSYLFWFFLATYGVFVHSIILAMMYRIIPFLVWLHLSNRGVVDAPTMHEVISPKRIWVHFYLHLLSFCSLLLSFWEGNLAPVSALLYGLSFGLLLVNLTGGVLIYIRKAYPRGGASPR